MKRNWTLYEQGYVHTSGLTKAEAEEMLERYNRIFPDLEFYIMQSR